MKITEIAAKRPLSTAALVLVVLVLGLVGFARLPVDFLPNITYPLIKVHIWWRGATPDEVNRQIADPVERVFSTVDGLDYLQSSSIEGMYTLQANFRYGVDVDVAYQDALAAMARIARELPKDIDPPIVIKADPSALPIVQLTVRSSEWDLVKLRDWVDRWLQDRLVAAPGVAGTEVVGGLKREIRVHFDPLAIERHQLGLDDLVKRLAKENVELSAGRVTVGKREHIARTTGEFTSLDELRNVVVARSGDARLLLRDVATVEDSHEEIRVITRLDGQPCVKLSVLKQADANTVEVARAVEQRLRELGPVLPPGVTFGVVENQAQYVESALNGVRNTAIEAAVLLVLLMALFLGNWRQVVAMTWALPFTILTNFAWMNLAGLSLNIFSLGGLLVAIAVDLDNSIIVIESITRLKHERPELDGTRLVIAAVSEVGPSVLASTMSFLVLFLPFLLVPGMATLLFRELILVIAGVMFISFVNAVAVTPTIMALLLRSARGKPREMPFERFVHRVTAAYGRSLEVVLGWRVAALAVFAGILAFGVLALPRLGSEFLPKMDDGRAMVKVRLPTGASLSQTDEALRKVESLVKGDPHVESAFTLAGGKVWGLYTYEIANEGELDIQLVPRHQRKESTGQYVARLAKTLQEHPLPGGKAMAMQMPVKGIRSSGQSEIEVKVRGAEVDQLFDFAGEVSQRMSSAPFLKNVHLSLDLNKPEYQVQVDRVKAADLGVSVADVATSLQRLVRGEVASRYREGDDYYGIRIMVPESSMTSRAAVGNLPLSCTVAGSCVRVSDVARVAESVGPVEIVREDQVKQVVILADSAGTSIGQALTGLRDLLATVNFPPGYEVKFGGQAQLMSDALRDLLRVLAFALFFAFVILVVQFNRLRIPGIILATVPVSLSGAALLLVATGIPAGATVVIGLLVVVAAHVTEGVLLLTYAETARAGEGVDAVRAVVSAATTRFRPRVMTALGVIVGLAPVALNLEAGGDMLQPMAVAAIGGLLVTAAVALYLVPVLYTVLTERAKRPEAVALEASPIEKAG
jgi:HAE1 family hydrophobic/amphiphilic exporter-1